MSRAFNFYPVLDQQETLYSLYSCSAVFSSSFPALLVNCWGCSIKKENSYQVVFHTNSPLLIVTGGQFKPVWDAYPGVHLTYQEGVVLLWIMCHLHKPHIDVLDTLWCLRSPRLQMHGHLRPEVFIKPWIFCFISLRETVSKGPAGLRIGWKVNW